MKNNQPKERKWNQDKIKELTVTMINSVATGLFAFIVIAIIINAFLIIFKISKNWILPIAFILALILSPFVLKFNFGIKLVNWYDKQLDKLIKKQ